MPVSGLDACIDTFEHRLARYIPAPDDWTPADLALYGPRNLFRIPPDEATEMQFRAIHHAFAHHYAHNPTYQAYCRQRQVCPEDIRNADDLAKIPLISDKFFKDYPAGKDFALWLGGIYTGSLPRIVVKQANPTPEQVVEAFNAAGLYVAYSSGTSGRHTFIPRDRRTYLASEYAVAKCVITMGYEYWDPSIRGYLLMPNPFKTNVYAGKVCSVYYDLIDEVQVAIDRDVSMEMLRSAMAGNGGLRASIVRYATQFKTRQMVDRIIRWLERCEREKAKITLVGAPFLVASIIRRLREQGRSFNFGERGAIVTGGGWKVFEGTRMPALEFRKQAEAALGIPQTHCLDVYGMVEGNGWMVHCPEGHYLHVPYSYFKPLVLDTELKPVGYGQAGRFAFLDAAASSYPGFLITGDYVRMLEHCPVCDRPGPVLEPEIRRASGEDVRGCGEEVRRMLAGDLGG